LIQKNIEKIRKIHTIITAEYIRSDDNANVSAVIQTAKRLLESKQMLT
jgi:hypothetical protein